MKKKCELCNKSAAKLFCESDEATLCWDCDAKVHSANFLVTKHPRILLCHVCQNLTPWHASGPNFVPTLSVCTHCVTKNDDHIEEEGEDEGEGEDEDEDEDDEENQVVPWALSSLPPVSNSTATTSSNKFSNGGGGGGEEGFSE